MVQACKVTVSSITELCLFWKYPKTHTNLPLTLNKNQLSGNTSYRFYWPKNGEIRQSGKIMPAFSQRVTEKTTTWTMRICLFPTDYIDYRTKNGEIRQSRKIMPVAESAFLSVTEKTTWTMMNIICLFPVWEWEHQASPWNMYWFFLVWLTKASSLECMIFLMYNMIKMSCGEGHSSPQNTQHSITAKWYLNDKSQ